MEQSAEQSSQLSMIIALLAAKVGANIKPQDIKEFMPVDWVAPYAPLVKKPEPKRVDPIEGARLLCASVFPVLKKPDDWDEELQARIALEKASK